VKNPPAGGTELKKILGPLDGVAIIIGVSVGAGILGAPGLIAGYLGNAFVMLGVWVFGGVSVALSTMILAEMGAMLPRAGGKYAYVRAAYGDRAGCFAGWAEVLFNRSFTGALKAVLIGQYLAKLIGRGSPGLYVVLLVVGYVALHLRGLRAGKRFQNVTTVIKVAVLLAVVATAFIYGSGASWTHVTPFAPAQGAFLAIALAYQSVFFTFYGVETSLQMSEELRDPGRSVPRMLLYGAASVTVIYLLMNVAFLHAMTPAEMAGSQLVARDVLARGLGENAATAITIASIAILVSSINVNFMGTPRIAFGLARDGLAPRQFNHVSERGTPTMGLLLTAAIILTLAVSGTFEALIRYMSFFTLIIDGVVLSSIFVLRRREPHATRPFRVPAYPLVPIVAVGLYALVLVIITVTQPKLALIAAGLLSLVAIASWVGVRKPIAPVTLSAAS
jgi:APA family basic amino acid/polyamine antiporter